MRMSSRADQSRKFVGLSSKYIYFTVNCDRLCL